MYDLSVRPGDILAIRKARYRAELVGKSVACALLRSSSASLHEPLPSVTLFVTTMNNHSALELTLRTMVANTDYPDYRIIVADNGSSAESRAVLDWAQAALPVSVIRERRPQSEWYDWASRELKTDLWLGIHDDMLFLGRDWLADMVRRMRAEPDLLLLTCEPFPAQAGMSEPVSGAIIDLGESLSTWLFCARRELGERLPSSSFAFASVRADGESRPFCYDVGGGLMADMVRAELRYAHMPARFRCKWHHIANLTWVRDHTGGVHGDLKLSQMAYVRRRVARLR